ncbi:MAG: YXWGXW repeat-containing protein [Deltaproteobacteria bacterium]|nr:MAG: YXWGXW repeat-containing protein [Deltaproteobacteria bacterium]
MIKLRFILYFLMVVTLTAFELGIGPRTIIAAEESALVPDEDVQVLASGPIHEAFAAVVALDPAPGIVAPKGPPPLIEEIPPQQKPEGDVQWIPGYWAWDDERNEYIWVSGIWRVPPPSRQWVPGYWTRVRKGYQWISGYWAGLKANGEEYLSEPPKSVEVGPSSNSPSPDYTWIPGCWVWHYGRYAWRPGYWSVVHPNWIWVPDRYIWTPRGYLFVSGYWDYTVIHRGVLFAPVIFAPRMYLELSFSFSPGFAIDLSVFGDALFLRPRYCHYYFGDYYAPKYYRKGIYPWFSLHASRIVYDPIYAHQRWNHRNHHEWENRLQTRFRERREHERLRPLQSFDYRTGSDKAGRSSGPERPNFVMPLDRVGKTKASANRFKPLSEKGRREFPHRKKKVRTFENERESRDTQRLSMLAEKASKKPEPNKEKFSRSPVRDRANEKADRKKAPPARYKVPKPNPNINPLKRKYDLSPSWGKSQKSEDRGQTSAAFASRLQRAKQVEGQISVDNVQNSGNRGGLLEDRMPKSNNRKHREDNGRRRWKER